MFHFKANASSENYKLADALIICVTAEGEENSLYNGLLKDMPADISISVGDNSNTKEVKVAVSLDSTAGNEYQTEKIKLDFTWWADGEQKCCPWCIGACPWCWITMLIPIGLIGVGAWFIFRKIKLKKTFK